MMQKENVVGIVIVTWNSGEVITPCLESIEKSNPDYLKNLVIVDNHSTDGSLEKIQNQFPQVRLIQNKENYGFSKAVNIGLKSLECKYFLLLNPDTEVRTDTIPKLIGLMESDKAIGIVGPLIYSLEDVPELSFGPFPNPWNEYAQRTRYYQLERKEPAILQWFQEQIKEPNDVDWVSGACFLIRKQVTEQIGYFDENFFAYFEDIDYCLRAHQSGWRVCYYPLTKIQHIRGYSREKNQEKMKIEYRKSQKYYYKKHCNFLSRMVLRVVRRISQK